MHDKKCATVFSAANYCGDSVNPGAVVVFDTVDSMALRMALFKAAHYQPLNEQTAAPAHTTAAPPGWRAKASSPPSSPRGVAGISTLAAETSKRPAEPPGRPVVAQPAPPHASKEEAIQVHPDSPVPVAGSVCPFTPWLRAGLSLTPTASARIALRLQLQREDGIIGMGAVRTDTHVRAGLLLAGQESKQASTSVVSCL
jgi:hypothetical protein